MNGEDLRSLEQKVGRFFFAGFLQSGMASEPCDVCGTDVRIAGGISGFWSRDQSGTGGMTLELVDGTEHFLCFDCIEALPEEPTGEDVAALAEERRV